jgi:hypothetical protein
MYRSMSSDYLLNSLDSGIFDEFPELVPRGTKDGCHLGLKLPKKIAAAPAPP